MLRQYVVNAFENGPFTGNPAAVVLLEDWPEDRVLAAIAAQTNLSETAFLVDGDAPRLRWFTPSDEIDLCGHATLATGHVLFGELGDARGSIEFSTLSGPLRVRSAEGGYTLDFPEGEISAAPGDLHAATLDAAGVDSGEVFVGAGRAVLVLDSADAVRRLAPDQAAVAQLPRGDLFVTAPGGDDYDCVSRVFAPGFGIPEDPVTGAAHCVFAPYWCERLGRNEISCWQASARGGLLRCRWLPDAARVELTGSCRTFARGEIFI